MSYTTIAAVTGSAWGISGHVEAAVVQLGIDTADGIIDGYCGRRFDAIHT